MIIHLNGRLVPHAEARISPFDRGLLFGEGIYEGLRSFGVEGRAHVFAEAWHWSRLREGLAAARIGFDPGRLSDATRELLEASGLADAFVYWQITRGAPAPGQPCRSRVPRGPERPTVLGFATPQPALDSFALPAPRRVVTVPDRRWAHGHVKSISLMGNVLVALEAETRGVDDAILIRDGLVSEATATNVALVVPDGRGGAQVVTPALDSAPILAGVTRAVLLAEPDLGVVERPVGASELERATEVMLLGTSTMVASVVEIDGRPVGDGRPGPHAARLLERLCQLIRSEARGRAPEGGPGVQTRPAREAQTSRAG
ncbi:MAG TPA: aminotransferase class IV [Phycisphaerales bacterium]|nr:aminotransferase class IV [Phycisphaerales bacterium]